MPVSQIVARPGLTGAPAASGPMAPAGPAAPGVGFAACVDAGSPGSAGTDGAPVVGPAGAAAAGASDDGEAPPDRDADRDDRAETAGSAALAVAAMPPPPPLAGPDAAAVVAEGDATDQGDGGAGATASCAEWRFRTMAAVGHPSRPDVDGAEAGDTAAGVPVSTAKARAAEAAIGGGAGSERLPEPPALAGDGGADGGVDGGAGDLADPAGGQAVARDQTAPGQMPGAEAMLSGMENDAAATPAAGIASVDAGRATTAAVPPAQVLAAPTPAHSQVAAAAVAMASDSGGTTSLRLAPEELGLVQIDLQTDGDRARLNVLAERAETLDLLRRHADRLADALREAGFGRLDLSFGRWSGSGGQDPPQGRPADPGPASADAPQATWPVASQGPTIVHDGLYLRI